MLSHILVNTFILIIILNPLEASIVLLSLKKDFSDIAKTSLIACIVVFVLSLFISFGSSEIFSHIHTNIFGNINEKIYISAFKITGGIILFFVGWIMLNGKRASKFVMSGKEKKLAKNKTNIAFIPLAVPVILGPGVFTTLVIMGDRAKTFFQKEILFISLFISVFIMYLSLKHSRKIIDFLGLHGVRILSILTGLFLMLISVLFFIGGLKTIWEMM